MMDQGFLRVYRRYCVLDRLGPKCYPQGALRRLVAQATQKPELSKATLRSFI